MERTRLKKRSSREPRRFQRPPRPLAPKSEIVRRGNGAPGSCRASSTGFPAANQPCAARKAVRRSESSRRHRPSTNRCLSPPVRTVLSKRIRTGASASARRSSRLFWTASRTSTSVSRRCVARKGSAMLLAGRMPAPSFKNPQEATAWIIPQWANHSGSANTKRVLPALGRSSGVRRLKAPDVSERPVLTATYWRPSWA